MRGIISGIAICWLAACAASASEVSTAQAEISRLEAALGEAMVHKDTAALTRIIADDWVCQSDSSVLTTKNGLIGDIRTGKLVMKSFRPHDMRIHVAGDMAYVLAADDEISSYAGKDGSGTYYWLDVWVKRNGRWAPVVTQLTKGAAKP